LASNVPDESAVWPGESNAREAELSPLFSNEEERNFRNRWKNIQTGFVDEPRRSVEQAEELIAKLLQRLAESFSASEVI
jgi:hypothetical protein